jgi:hypothetical protein
MKRATSLIAAKKSWARIATLADMTLRTHIKIIARTALEWIMKGLEYSNNLAKY